MAIILPALKATMGSTTYFEATMPAREVVSGFRPARELDGWANMTIDERMQRDPNLKRIKDEIVPYLARSKDRLFGALIILIYRGDITFEPIGSIGSKLPAAYQKSAEKIGFITIDGGELIVLDGQHRLLALREIVQNGADGEFAGEVASDDISVIFIKHETDEKTRRIFNKVNRYAKPTSRGDNIITSEDDGYAILTRRLLDDAAPLGRRDGKDVVEWKSNTLSDRSLKFTTISTVYETVKDILASEGFGNLDEKHQVNRPSAEILENAYHSVEYWWNEVLKITVFQTALADASMIPELRKDTAPNSLLFKPIGQMALFKGLVHLVKRKVKLATIVKKVPTLDWSIASPIWKDILVSSSGRMIARKEAYEIAGRLVAYLLAPAKFTKSEIAKLREEYNAMRGYNPGDPASELEQLPEVQGDNDSKI